MPAPVALIMAPPVQLAAEEQVPPLAEIVRPLVEPVLFNTIPLVAPLDEMLLKVRPLAPMVVFVTLSAAPVVDEIVLMIVELSCVALTVAPLPDALKPTPEVVVRLM